MKTLLPVFTPFAPAATVVGRFPDALAVALRAHGAPGPVINREVAAAGQVLAETNSRSVLGVMNEFVHLAEWRRDEIPTPTT